MTEQLRIFEEPPDEETPLWRYTSLAKLLNMIRQGKRDQMHLIALRADKFEDDYEGTLSENAKEKLRKDTVRAYNATYDIHTGDTLSLLDHIADEAEKELAREFLNAGPQSWAKQVKNMVGRMRKITFANCWRMDDYEDSNMWRSYTSKSDGIVIKSTFGKLRDSIVDWRDVLHLGRVNYIDFEKEDMKLDPVSPYFYKQRQFVGESEVRLVNTKYSSSNFNPVGGTASMPEISSEGKRPIIVNQDTLLEEIRVHPQSREYLLEVVKHELQNNNVQVEVNQSSLRPSLS